MRVQVTKEFLLAEDGNTVREVQAGEVLEGEGAEHALRQGKGEQLDAVAPAPVTEDVKPEAAPEVKAVQKAPKNKSK
jgi:hypothetical protein